MIFLEKIPAAFCSERPILEQNIFISAAMPNPVGEDYARMPEGEWVEISNVGIDPVSLAGWVLYDSDDKHELFITSENTQPKKEIPLLFSGEKMIVFRDGDSDFSLDEEKDSIRLFSGPLEMEGELLSRFDYNASVEGQIVPHEIKETLIDSGNKEIDRQPNKESENKEDLKREKKEPLTSFSAYGSIDKNRLKEDSINQNDNFGVEDSPNTFIAGTGPSNRKLGSLWDSFFARNFSLKLFLLAWSVLTGAIFLTGKILKTR